MRLFRAGDGAGDEGTGEGYRRLSRRMPPGTAWDRSATRTRRADDNGGAERSAILRVVRGAEGDENGERQRLRARCLLIGGQPISVL